MDSLVLHPVSLESARGFCAGLAKFGATLVEAENGRYQVEIPLSGNREIVAVLNALKKCVTQRADSAS
ncbi:MAG TPA: hypothetical protein VF025_11445 [Gaiellaceae bacterium]